MATRAEKTLNIIAQTIYDMKGANILALDVRQISTMTDYYIIAEGNVDRHIKAISGAIQDSLLIVGERALHVEGAGSDWMVIDYDDVVVHLFIPETRETYALEELWRSAHVVDIRIELN